MVSIKKNEIQRKKSEPISWILQINLCNFGKFFLFQREPHYFMYRIPLFFCETIRELSERGRSQTTLTRRGRQVVKNVDFHQLLRGRKCLRRSLGGQKLQNLVNLVCERSLMPQCIIINPGSKLRLRGHSTTTWIKFYPILTPTPTHPLRVDKNGHFTYYLPFVT